MNEPLASGSVIGILGGGQLGRMLSVAASRLGLRTHIFEPSDAPPAADVAHAATAAPYEDSAALKRFAEAVDVITYEFENIPTHPPWIRWKKSAQYGPAAKRCGSHKTGLRKKIS